MKAFGNNGMREGEKMMSDAIVTGANGFLGKALVKALAEQGVQVCAIVRRNAKNIDDLCVLKNVTLIECDMSEYSSLQSKLETIAAESVFYHFAWSGTAGDMRADETVQLDNVKYACEAVTVAAKLKCKKFIFASSVMEYEVVAAIAHKKELGKTAIYAIAKMTANYMCRVTANSLQLDYTDAVISNVYGVGECSPRLINTSIQKLLRGDYVKYSSGEQMYDFIYITDAVEIFIQIGRYSHKNKQYYIGSRCPKPLKEFLCDLRDVIAPTQKIGLGEIQFTGVSLTYQEFDTQAVYQDFSFEPSVSFSQGIAMTSEWIKNEMERGCV